MKTYRDIMNAISLCLMNSKCTFCRTCCVMNRIAYDMVARGEY